ncbi:MAG: cytochrome b/b6 domain-containing protein [Ghiorsea sp.]
MYYDKFTRLLHWCFAVMIPLQLLSEELMKRPKPLRIRDDMQVFWFDMHEWVGMLLLTVIVIRFGWAFISKEFSFERLYPYLYKARRVVLKTELAAIPGWFKGNFPDLKHEYYLAGAVHGLGLLLVLAMGVTGAMMLYGMEETGLMTGIIHEAKEAHEMLGGLLWAYLIAHVAMTIIHKFLGHSLLGRIFGFNEDKA